MRRLQLAATPDSPSTVQEVNVKQVLPIASGKGGVGKTTIAQAAALVLADLCGEVFYCDADPLSNGDLRLCRMEPASGQEVSGAHPGVRYLRDGIDLDFERIYRRIMCHRAPYAIVDFGAGIDSALVISRFGSMLLVLEAADASRRDAAQYLKAVAMHRWAAWETGQAEHGAPLDDGTVSVPVETLRRQLIREVLNGVLTLDGADRRLGGRIRQALGGWTAHVLVNRAPRGTDKAAVKVDLLARTASWFPVEVSGEIAVEPSLSESLVYESMHGVPQALRQPVQQLLHELFSTPGFQSDSTGVIAGGLLDRLRGFFSFS